MKRKKDSGIANAMRMGAKEKANKLYVKMMKLVAVAHPGNGPEFLEEVIVNFHQEFYYIMFF